LGKHRLIPFYFNLPIYKYTSISQFSIVVLDTLSYWHVGTTVETVVSTKLK
jgi:hypothetical protein